MPSFETAWRRQKALLWEIPEGPAGYDNYGQPKRAVLSEELKVRWVNGQSQVVDPQGNTITVDATVITNRAVGVGSVMWQGSLEDLAAELPGTGTGTDLLPSSGVMEVVAYSPTHDIKGRNIRHVLGLKFYRDSMPESA